MAEIVFENVKFTHQESESPLFTNLSLELPSGLVTLVGPNGTGKSTLMLLAGARLTPDSGRVLLFGNDTKSINDDATKQELVSFIYQNMEFETEEPIESLIEFVYANGFQQKKTDDFMEGLIDVFELESFLSKRMQELSKGEQQRAILAFSFLYGSKIIMMDEPVFSLEQYQKEKALEFISAFSRDRGQRIYYSAHELDLSIKYSAYSLLFYKDGRIVSGAAGEILTPNNLEEAYDAPYSMLKQRESIFRNSLK